MVVVDKIFPFNSIQGQGFNFMVDEYGEEEDDS
jgi:hypothetical protein